jgi:hypothetical protein
VTTERTHTLCAVRPHRWTLTLRRLAALATVAAGVGAGRAVLRKHLRQGRRAQVAEAAQPTTTGGPGASARSARAGQSRRTLAAAGLLVIVASVYAGWYSLRVRPVPIPPTFSVVFQSPVPVRPGRGFLVSTTTLFSNCGQPALVLVTATPSAEFWIDNATRISTSAHLAFGVDDRAVTSAGFVDEGGSTSYQVTPLSDIHPQAPYMHGPLYVMPAVVSNWAKTRGPVTVELVANWLTPRSGPPLIGRSCYLRLPAITGFPAIGAAGYFHEPSSALTGFVSQIHDGTITSEPNASLGRNTVIPAGAVQGALSQPAPTTQNPDGSHWQCQGSPFTIGAGSTAPHDVSSDGASVAALREPIISQGGCAALAVVDDTSFDTVRELLLLVLGAALAIGAQLLVEAFRRSR